MPFDAIKITIPVLIVYDTISHENKHNLNDIQIIVYCCLK